MNTSFLTDEQVRRVERTFGTPVFVYSQPLLEHQALKVLAFPNAYGLTGRFAMKALPTRAVLRIFDQAGLHFDASSGFEVLRAQMAGIPLDHISLTAQELPPGEELRRLVVGGLKVNACSLQQLRILGEILPDREFGIRVNPGLGSGHSNRTNVGGPSASFGIWHEYLAEAIKLATNYGLRITTLHSHIGSGSDPLVWENVAGMTLDIALLLPDVMTVDLGGGFKVGRMPGEISTDLTKCGSAIVPLFETFFRKTGRKLKVEIEPGTFLVANAGCIVATVMDKVDTGEHGYTFLKLNTGMTELLRPGLYGAQHPITIISRQPRPNNGTQVVLVCGHCCESGDTLTPGPGNPESLLPRELGFAQIGDFGTIGGAGAYGAAMSSKNYNSFLEAAEVLLRNDGSFELIRKRQTLEHMLQNEM